MDRQCQDRCHRIGQTRDVHIYRFVSEHTIEANILRKSNQKRLLDDVIIQQADFTTDYFNNRLTYRDALDEQEASAREDAQAGAAMDRIFTGLAAGLGTVLATAEDKEDTEAAKVAQKEMVQLAAEDLAEQQDTAATAAPATAVTTTAATTTAATTTQSATQSATPKMSESGPTPGESAQPECAIAAAVAEELPHLDEYLIRFVDDYELASVPLAPPREESKKARKSRDHRLSGYRRPRWR